jgi:hypothetical protein
MDNKEDKSVIGVFLLFCLVAGLTVMFHAHDSTGGSSRLTATTRVRRNLATATAQAAIATNTPRLTATPQPTAGPRLNPVALPNVYIIDDLKGFQVSYTGTDAHGGYTYQVEDNDGNIVGMYVVNCGLQSRADARRMSAIYYKEMQGWIRTLTDDHAGGITSNGNADQWSVEKVDPSALSLITASGSYGGRTAYYVVASGANSANVQAINASVGKRLAFTVQAHR